MNNDNTITWEGESGNNYKYWILPIDSSFKDEPGNYIFAKETEPNTWVAVYIGQTDSLKKRLENHNEDSCVQRNGATHIHAHTNSSGEDARKSEEQDLIPKWKPTCNDLHKN